MLSLFNGISTFVGYSMPKPCLQKFSGDNIQPIPGGGVMSVIPLLRVLVQK